MVDGITAGPSTCVICCKFVVSAMCVTVPLWSICQTRPFSQVTIMLWPNEPSLSNVIPLWSDNGQPPNTPDRVANCAKVPLGGVALKIVCTCVMKRSPGVNPAAADSCGAIARYSSSTNPTGGSVPNNEAFPWQSIISTFPLAYSVTKR